MSAYRSAAAVPQDDLRALVREATALVRRERLERRLETFARVLNFRVSTPTRPSSGDVDRVRAGEGEDPAGALLWPFALLLLPIALFATVGALGFWACTAIARAWTEWRRYGRRYHPLPV